MTGALDGIKVLDLSMGAAGPSCAMYLGDMGAEVIKVEPPGGEWGRMLGPPFINGVSAAFLGINRNKQSILIDLAKPSGARVILRLARTCDVVIESFRPGVADRLGIGYEDIRALNPRVIYLGISAFGQEGPWRDRPGVDGVVQAMSGIMSVTGSENGPPVKVGVPAGDMVGGAFSVQAVLAALFARERTGEGQRVDVSLLDALLAFQVIPVSMYLATGEELGRQGSAAPYASPNEAYPTKDGYVMVGAYTPQRWHSFCEAIGHPELETDPRFAENGDRVRNRPELRAFLDPVFADRTTNEWVEILDSFDILCGPLLGYPELLSHEHVAVRKSILHFDHPDLGPIHSVPVPARMSLTPGGHRRLPPAVPGEDGVEVLEGAGFTKDEIEALFSEGAVQ